MLKAIMYHYVRPYNEELPFFKNLDVTDFSQQLDYFENEYGFADKADFIAAFDTGIAPKGVVLTFDDGLKCHYEYAYQELRKRKLWGIFYIPTGPYGTGKMLDVHRIHLLLGKYSGIEIYKELMALVTDEMLPGKRVREFRERTYHDQQNDDSTRLVKQILNYYIGYEYREQVIDSLMEKLIPEASRSVENFYLTPSEINEMHAGGMLIGSHTVTHPVLSKIGMADQQYEIESSFDWLQKTTGSYGAKTFCYPYGGFHSFTDETETLLTQNDCLFSFNVEHRDISSADFKTRPQALPRYDCNAFPFGTCR